MSETLFDHREGFGDVIHILMPNMAYACDGNILTKQGGFQVGITDWNAITCAGCREDGEASVRAEIAAQQGRQAGVA